MKAEIITCGTELLLGEITDTNTPYLARELATIGVSVYHHVTVGDNPQRLLETIRHAETRSNLILISGGLGPTQDDITKDVLAEHLNLNLVPDPPSLEKIKARYESDEITAPNQHQAMVIEDAVVLTNDIGMAAGILVKKDNYQYVLLPGPPNEFEQMVTEHLIPHLKEQSDKKVKFESRNLNFYGLPEATISEKLADLIEEQTNPTIAIYAKKGIIDIRLTVSGEDDQRNQELLDQVEMSIRKRIGDYFVSYNKQTIEDIIQQKLHEENSTLAVAEVNVNSQFLVDQNNQNDFNPLRASLYFSTVAEAQQCFQLNHNKLNRQTIIQQNEKLALRVKEKITTDYGLAITAFGTIAGHDGLMPESLYLTIVNRQGAATHKKVDFTQRMYLAGWVIRLKISDFVRRYLLDLKQLDN